MATIEFLFLANHAEVQNGLLYASGAGWSELYRGQPSQEGQPPPPHHFAVATSVLVPWEETNQPHNLTIQIGPEGGEPLSQVEVGVEVGRPPGLDSKIEQRAILVVTANLPFPEAGNYHVVAQVSEERRSVGFRVHDEQKPPFFR